MNPVQLKPKTIIYFLTIFLTGLALLHEILKQTGIEKIKELYLKKISASIHTVGLLEKDPEYGLYISGDFAKLQESQVYFLDAQVKGQGDRPIILLFNSMQYSSNMWLKLGVIHELAKNGYRSISIDLPGYGGSDKVPIIDDDARRIRLMEQIVKFFQLDEFVAVTPGYSGEYFLPFIFESHAAENALGWVPISPDGVKRFSLDEISLLPLPTLILFGEYDSAGEQDARTLAKMPNSSKKIFYSSGKHCFVDDPQYFISSLLNFMQTV
ncbi:Oidioi.mRNA.OKI2018_I69.chr2.g7884.t1.cds [Oikopleura dioica]|uniref:Oidioi.mRNA.OKI2018_I69.chr2.g7884.t1.cds n=1 Tax=Oikopleura dioica TaxID=34765 RepID=A0ABN7TDF1_OIKDI|nr:Oidioi.mRNA.OKI2018_I69.chr2.g7884.t1.cds [Oikopleura dioica]